MGRQPWPHYIGDQEVWFLEPERTLVRLQDLRKPLATQRRYGGGYDVTVLAHLALCTALSSDSSRLHRAYAAAHDLHEAIVIDVPSSLKPLLPDYREIEDAWAAHVHRSVGLPWPLLPGAEHHVQRIDVLAGLIEMTQVGHPSVRVQSERMGREATMEENETWGWWYTASEDEQWELVSEAVRRAEPVRGAYR